MIHVRRAADLDECEELWRQVMPREFITDLWEFRESFYCHYHRPLCFLVAEGARSVLGLLPLSWIEESACHGYFPGETWHGKTWIEQNRIETRGWGVLEALLEAVPGPYHLRYLLSPDLSSTPPWSVDEVGYLFSPPNYDYDIENYFREFSSKSAKRLKRELAAIERLGVPYRYDDPADFEHIVRLNVERFGEHSYFRDVRFRDSFRSLAAFLQEKGWLRMTTVLIDGEPAAADMGCVYGGVYTLLAGGTHGGYPGIAKFINIHHMRRACEERLCQVDFLCGDFSWKKLFHLKPRPLYLLSNVAPACCEVALSASRSIADVR